jgi:hypothetical protein
MKEKKEVTIRPKNEFECGLDCQYLRKYDSLLGGHFFCILFSTKLPLIADATEIHRAPKCDGTYLFTMKVPDDESQPISFETDD